MITTIFWSLILLILYTYIGYPFLLTILSDIKKREFEKNTKLHFISIIIAVHNEEKTIKQTLRNIKKLEYPKNKLEIIIVDDKSDDKTLEILRKETEIKVLEQERKGKTAAQNLGAEKAKGEILVFLDAETIYPNNILEKINRDFSNGVGLVSGSNFYKKFSFQKSYEDFIRKKESEIAGIIGATGAIYAIKRQNYTKLDGKVSSDFVSPAFISRQGLETKYDSEIKSYEKRASNFKSKLRIANQTWFDLWKIKFLFNPSKYKFLSLELFSHKLLRYLTPFFLIGLFITNLFLLNYQIFQYFLLAQFFIYFLFILTLIFRKTSFEPAFAIIRDFFTTQLAFLIGFMMFILRIRKVKW